MSRRAPRSVPFARELVATLPQPRREPDRLLLTVEEAGAALGVGRSLMYELIARGDIRTVRVGRLRRVRPEALHEFVGSLE